jgi:drug/metabolite transporter (DMT)-like permease
MMVPGRPRLAVGSESELTLTISPARPGARSQPASRPRTRSATRAALGSACTSPMPVLVTLAATAPVPTVFYRCAFALPVLGVLALAEQRRRGPRPPASRIRPVAAGLFLAVDLVLFNHTITDAGAGVSTVIGSLYVPFVAVLAWAVLRERPDRRYLVALPVVLLGVILVSGLAGGSGTGPDPAAGVLYALGASAAYACFLLIIRQTGDQTRHVAGQLFDATAGTTAGSLVIGLAFGGLHLAVPWRSLWWLLLLALIVQVAGWMLITSSLPGLPASVSSLLLLVQPAAALVLAAVILHQRPTLLQVAGALLVCGGGLIVARPPAGRQSGLAAS